MQPSTDTELNAVLAELVKSVQTILGEKFLAAYLQGSFGVGDWDKDSDVDFTIVISEDLTDREVLALNANQARIFEMESYWAKHLEGSFWPLELLKPEYANKNEIWYVDNGSVQLERSVHDNTLVVRWVTYECGITLAGQDAKTLLEPIETAAMQAEIRDVIHDWGAEILGGSYQLDNRWAQPHVVLSYCRMLHSLETGRIHSKPKSAAWCIANLDKKWHGLIQRALDERKNQFGHGNEKANPDDLVATQHFIHYAFALAPQHKN